MRLLTLVPVLALAACNAASNAADSAGQSGSTASQRSFEVGTFQSVALGGSNNVVVHVGGARSVRAEGPAEALDHLDIKVEHGVLEIGEKNNWHWSSHKGVTVYVTAPALDGASIGGSGNMRIDTVSGQHFAASVGGSGDLDIGSLKVEEASLSVAGSGNMKAAGATGNVRISLVGSGDVDAGDLEARDAHVSVAGSGNATLRASGNAALSVVGSGDITVHGNAKCSISKLGSGDVHCVG